MQHRTLRTRNLVRSTAATGDERRRRPRQCDADASTNLTTTSANSAARHDGAIVRHQTRALYGDSEASDIAQETRHCFLHRLRQREEWRRIADRIEPAVRSCFLVALQRPPDA